MKRVVSILLTISALFVMGGWTKPIEQSDETDTCLIDYLETHEVNDYEEFLEIICDISPDSIDDENTTDITYFSVDIDYDNMLVSVTTISNTNMGRARGVGNTASKTYYSSSGFKIFTISVTGTFNYTSGSCTTVSASGSYTRATLSLWTSTPTISSGNITTKKAYAKISGTASSGSSSVSYSLTLTCDDSGNFTSY